MGTKIIGTGSFVPETTVSNNQLKQLMDTSDEWIQSRTGIVQRHISKEDTSVLCGKAALDILKKADILPEEIDFIIVATMSPDYLSPSTACLVQDYIGARPVMAFDINAACSGFIYALSVADKLMASSQFEYGLVIGGEVMSKIIDWNDRSTAVLFGDGAAGVLLKKTTGQSFIMQEDIHSDGSRSTALTAGKRALKDPFSTRAQEKTVSDLQMEGRTIFDFALRNVSKSMKDVTEAADLELNQIDLIIAHQANYRILKGIAKKIKQPIEKFASNMETYGNTSAASIPILLDELIENGSLSLTSGQKIILSGFGGGLTWGSLLIKL